VFRTKVVFRCVLVSGLLVGAACGSDDDPATGGTGDTSDVSLTPATTGAPIPTQPAPPKPEVETPAASPTELVVTDLEEGTGPEAKDGDQVLVYYVGVRSDDGTEFDNNFDSGQIFPVTLGAGGVIEGWDEGLVGVKSGGVRQLDIPAELAYKDQGSGEIIKPGDALSFVIQVAAVVPATSEGDEPEVEVTPSTGATAVTSEDLVPGSGAAIEVGQTLNLHIIAYRGDTGEKLQSTWASPTPVEVQYARQTLTPPGLFEGLEGMKAGGRRVITIPAADAFGEEGNDALSMPAATDFIVVVDLFAAY